MLLINLLVTQRLTHTHKDTSNNMDISCENEIFPITIEDIF